MEEFNNSTNQTVHKNNAALAELVYIFSFLLILMRIYKYNMNDNVGRILEMNTYKNMCSRVVYDYFMDW